MIILYRLTETLEGKEVHRHSLERAKATAYDMVIRMVHDNTQLGRDIRKVSKWDGGNTQQLRLRYGKHFVNVEKVK